MNILDLALADTEPGHPLIVERSDGHRSFTDLGWWRREPTANPPIDTILGHWICTGETAIDVGCATGRQLELLRGRGVNAYGIDSSALAVQQAQQRGMDAEHADALQWTPATPVDAVLALGGGAGICGTHANLQTWLDHLASWLVPQGRLIVTSVDWRHTKGHEQWIQIAEAAGNYPGDVRLRLRYREHLGQWFPWLWIDPDALLKAAASAGLSAGRAASWGAKYGVELRKNGPGR